MKCNYIYWKEMRIESLHPLKGGIGFKTSVIPVRLPKGNTRKHWLCAITSTHKHLKPELNTNRTQIIKNRKNIELHAPVQPKSLSWWEEVGNSLIFQHSPSRGGSLRPQTWNRSEQQLFYLIALTRIRTRDLALIPYWVACTNQFNPKA